MSKSLITRVWLAGLAAFVAGLVIAAFSVGWMAAYGGGTWERMPMMHYGYQYVPGNDGGLWIGMSVLMLGGTIVAIGALVQLAAWVGALINTNALADKTWFTVLLAGGILGFFVVLAGFAVMLAYVVAGPDGTAQNAGPRKLAPTA